MKRIVIIGAGEVGYHIADVLSKEGNNVVVIDKNEDHLRDIAESLDVQTILGSGSSLENLREARIDQAEMVIAVTDSDETNMIACLLASTQTQVPIRIARIRNPELSDDQALLNKTHLNIDLCINPEREAVGRIMNLLESPGASEVVTFSEGRVKLVGFTIDDTAAVIGRPLMALREGNQEAKVLITAVIRNHHLVVPSGLTVLQAKDYVFAVAESSQVREVLRFFGKERPSPKRVIIIGGGHTGLMLAMEMERRGLYTKIIEKRRSRCEEMTRYLEKTIVLHGDGTSQDLLRQEHIDDTDLFIAVTNDEEANILGAVLAKQLGAKKVLSLINRVDYSPLVDRVGIDGVLNPRHAAISRILHFIRKGKIISATPLSDERVEAFEFIALETSDITQQPFKDIRFPRGTIVGAVMRGEEVIIPGGDTVVMPGDHVIIFTPRSAIHDVEKLLTVKLEYFG